MDRVEDSATAVIRVIREEGPIHRSEIARRLGLSPSRMTFLVKRLLSVGIVVETAEGGEARGERLGRPVILLKMRPDFAAVAGVKLDRDEINAVLTDLEGKVLARRSRRLDTSAPERVVGAIKAMVAFLGRAAGVDAGRIAGLGLGMSGLVDDGAGVCLRSVVLDWVDVPIGSMLERSLGLPVAVENDGNTLAIAEHTYGRARGLDDFAVVSFGKGVGSGLFVRGRLYRGRFGSAGELGHCTVRVDGPLCACGKRGCLEAVASVPATLARAVAMGLSVDNLAGLRRLAREGTGGAAELLDDIGDAVGLALSHLVNLVNPEVLILTGSGVAIGRPLRGAIEASLAKHVLPTLPRLPELVVMREQRDIWARGAASLAARSYLQEGRWEGSSSP